jgi:hypothetical protein
MMDKIKKILNDWFTEVDNKTFDITKVLAILAIVAGVGLSVFSVVYKGQAFNYQDYGIGTAALFAGVAVALGLKKETKNVDDISN